VLDHIAVGGDLFRIDRLEEESVIVLSKEPAKSATCFRVEFDG